MAKLILKDVKNYVEKNIDSFHNLRLQKLEKLNFKDVLKRKNPYLFKAKNIITASDLMKGILDAFLQSQEETLFGEFLEGIAVFACNKVYGGIKSTKLEGIDLVFTKNDVIYIVEVKSGPNWGNSSQLKKMQDNFKNAITILKNENPKGEVIAVNGCCYGIDNNPDKKGYFKYCGQEFWTFISNDSHLYLDIIEPLGYKAQEKNDEFAIAYAKVINKFTFKFGEEFCKKNGEIDWKKIVEFNSQKTIKTPKVLPKSTPKPISKRK